MKAKELIRLLEANGWVLLRTRGDHRIFKKEALHLKNCQYSKG